MVFTKRPKLNDDDYEVLDKSKKVKATRNTRTRKSAEQAQANLQSQIQDYGTYSKPKITALKYNSSTKDTFKIEKFETEEIEGKKPEYKPYIVELENKVELLEQQLQSLESIINELQDEKASWFLDLDTIAPNTIRSMTPQQLKATLSEQNKEIKALRHKLEKKSKKYENEVTKEPIKIIVQTYASLSASMKEFVLCALKSASNGILKDDTVVFELLKTQIMFFSSDGSKKHIGVAAGMLYYPFLMDWAVKFQGLFGQGALNYLRNCGFHNIGICLVIVDDKVKQNHDGGLILPSPRTIQNHVSKLKINTGICSK